MITVSLLRGFDLFQGLEDSEVERIIKLCKLHSVKEGDQIFKEGARATHLHLCQTCEVDLSVWVRDPWNKDIVIQRIEAGQLHGWSAIVPPYTYTASAKCVKSGDDLRISGHEIMDVFDQYPRLGYTVMRNLSAHIGDRLLHIRRSLTMEWLNGGTQVGSRAFGELGKR